MMSISSEGTEGKNKKFAHSAVTITIGREVISGTISDMQNEDWVDDVQQRSKKKKPLNVHIRKLLTLSNQDRWLLLSFVSGLKNAKVKIDLHPEVDGLLPAVLATVETGMDTADLGVAKSAALEVTVFLYPGAHEVACQMIADKFKVVGFEGFTKAKLVNEADGIAAAIVEGNQARSADMSGKTVKSIWPDAPVSDDLIVPPAWSLTKVGVTSNGVDEKTAGAIPAPLVITGRLRDPVRGVDLLRVAWFRDGEWRSVIVDREVAASSRSIVCHAAQGLPVTSISANTLVQYLADFETANLGTLPLSAVADQLGWHTVSGQTYFLWGTNVIAADGIIDSNGHNGDDKAGTALPPIYFRGADEGDQQLASGFHARGSFAKWREAIATIARYPQALLAFYAGFVPPLLYILSTPSFVLSLSGETTSGKTITQAAIASIWGAPIGATTDKGLAMFSWKGTPVWRERTRTGLRDVPFVLDDSKHARNPQEVADVIYEVSQGLGKGRGSQKGLAKLSTCRTVMITSGEQTATSHTQDGGTRARVLELWGSPFGERNQTNGAVAQELGSQVLEHYGLAGPLFVQYLLKHKDLWPKWRKEFHKCRANFVRLAAANSIAGRMAEHFAALCLAARLAHKALNLPWQYADPVAPLREQLFKEASEADRPTAALRDLVGWATANEARFYFKDAGSIDRPPIGWVGRWDNRSPKVHRWTWLGVIPNDLRALLTEWKYDTDAIIRAWRERGWLVLSTDKDESVRTQYRTRIGSNLNARVYAIRRSAVEKVMGVPDVKSKSPKTVNSGNSGNAGGNKK